jgi:CTP synthase
LEKERQGFYLGKTVQVVPHIVEEVITWIDTVAHKPLVFDVNVNTYETADICIIELGGTIGDIESDVFVEALHRLECKVEKGNFMCIHVGLVPSVVQGGEHKSKPTQQSISTLRSLGLTPSIVACRCNIMVNEDVRTKIAMCAGLDKERVISIPDVKDGNLWNVPLILASQHLQHHICSTLDLISHSQVFNIDTWQTQLAGQWDKLMAITDDAHTINIGVVGKYVEHSDAYLSVVKGLQHASIKQGLKLIIKWIEASSLETTDDLLKDVDGVLIPGGFGQRGVEGMINACKYCRINKVPFLGICLGMQVSVIEYCRNVLGIHNATSQEFMGDSQSSQSSQLETTSCVIVNKNEQGSMCLGLQTTILNPFSLACQIYNETIVQERHRHRYMVHPHLIPILQNAGMTVSGKDATIAEQTNIVELSTLEHPFYVGCQFHPEYKTRPLQPSPPFLSFIQAVHANKKNIHTP